MKLSYHNVLHPRAMLAGLLVADEEERSFDYVPIEGAERGTAFAGTLRQALESEASPARILRHYINKGGPHLYESLSSFERLAGDAPRAALTQLAQQQGWTLAWQEAVSSHSAAESREAVEGSAQSDPVTYGEATFPALPRSLKQAMTLQTLAVLLRRHHTPLGLRLMELHPCGGMYDCLGLVTRKFEHSLCLFNLAGSGLLLEPLGRPRPPHDAEESWSQSVWRYPRAYFSSGGPAQLADVLEARLGLPALSGSPSRSATTISVAVMAQLAQRFSLSEKAPYFRSGWLDTSGMEGSSVRSWVAEFPELMKRCEETEPGSMEAARVAGRLWAIGSEPHIQRPALIIDLATGQVRCGGKNEGSLWSRYRKGAGIRELAWWLEGLWKRE